MIPSWKNLRTNLFSFGPLNPIDQKHPPSKQHYAAPFIGMEPQAMSTSLKRGCGEDSEETGPLGLWIWLFNFVSNTSFTWLCVKTTNFLKEHGEDIHAHLSQGFWPIDKYVKRLRRTSKQRIRPSTAPETSSSAASSSDTSVKVHVRRLDECLGLKTNKMLHFWFVLERTCGLRN